MAELGDRHVHILRVLDEVRPLCVKQVMAHLTDLREGSVASVYPCFSGLLRLHLIEHRETWPRTYVRTPAGTAELPQHACVLPPAASSRWRIRGSGT